MQARKSLYLAKSLFQDFGAKARTSHTEQKNVAKILFADLICKTLELVLLFKLLFVDIEPSQPLGLIAVRPQRRIALPEPLDFPARAPIIDRFGSSRSQSRRQLVTLLAD